MKKIKIILAVLLTSFLNTSYASNYIFDFSYDGSLVTVNQDAYGQNLSVGDTVTATFHAVGGYWQTTEGYFWPVIGISESGTRFGDQTYDFYANNVLVNTHSQTNTASSYAHIIQGYDNSILGVDFNKLVVTYVLNSSDSAINTFFNGFQYLGGSLSYGGTKFIAGVLPSPSPVPVPAALWLFGSGLLGLLGVKRKKSALTA